MDQLSLLGFAMTTVPDYLTTAEAALYLRISITTLEHWRQLRAGPAYIRLGRNVRYSRAALDAYAATQSVGGVA